MKKYIGAVVSIIVLVSAISYNQAQALTASDVSMLQSIGIITQAQATMLLTAFVTSVPVKSIPTTTLVPVMKSPPTPVISYLNVNQGNTGQYITIYGKNFSTNLIEFKAPANETFSQWSAQMGSANPDVQPVYASANGTQLQFVIPNIPAGNYQIDVLAPGVTAWGAASNLVSFTVVGGSVSPIIIPATSTSSSNLNSTVKPTPTPAVNNTPAVSSVASNSFSYPNPPYPNFSSSTPVSTSGTPCPASTGLLGRIAGSVGACTTTPTPAPISAPTSTPVSSATITASLGSLSPVSQYVTGGSTFPIATYNVISTGGSSIITEMDFTDLKGANNAITSVTVGGITAPVVNGSAVVTGLNIVVPTGYAGLNIPASVVFNNVGMNGIATNQPAGLTLTAIKSTSNSVTKTVNVNIPSNNMTLVASKPTVVIPNAGSSVALNGQTELIDVTVSADPAGDINVDQLPIMVTTNGGMVSISKQSVVVKDQNNNILATTIGTLAVPANSSGKVNVTFTGGYRVPAGSSQTFKIFVSPSNYNGPIGTLSIQTSLNSPSLFTWTDVNGGSKEGALTGTGILNWPTSMRAVLNLAPTTQGSNIATVLDSMSVDSFVSLLKLLK